MPKGGTIKLNTRAMHTNTAGRTIYNQGARREKNCQRKTKVRKKAISSPGSLRPASTGVCAGPSSIMTFLAGWKQWRLKSKPLPLGEFLEAGKTRPEFVATWQGHRAEDFTE